MDNLSLSLPYPSVEPNADGRDLNRLYDLYAGRFSEMTTILSYEYQSIICPNDCLQRLLKGIAIVEMHHLDLLARAIHACGGDPVFAGQYNYFSGRYADYEKDICLFLQNDIIAERNTATDYRRAAEVAVNLEVGELLCRIAMDEELHAEILTSCLNEMQSSK